MTPARKPVVERLVDTLARRPSGAVGKFLYAHPAGHQAGFRKALAASPLDPGARVLDVGCGGGVFLEQALASGCRAVGFDHSPDMIGETRRRNAAALDQGRLAVVEGDAAALPFPECSFTHVFCLHAFFFFPRPAEAIAEMARVLEPHGVLTLVTTHPSLSPWLRGVFAPMIQRMRLDTAETLSAWATNAGLRVEHSALGKDASVLFVARKPGPSS
ncbi:class I SAM-dependent methyltransferase [Pararhodospirillum oryzae]|uniref:Methyltransferase type 11 domain-containing protein n=1 Tax=Pararhodospirillum oryzae TaxID=478448 RepID=A0A512HC10_9PROT|nr:class I SAM-dependent methyltransferase [Pararhodospirillum oryzae]GEO82988.1 hypothetical protein ROR02_31190 [Pararhodospirillum oryzae]